MTFHSNVMKKYRLVLFLNIQRNCLIQVLALWQFFGDLCLLGPDGFVLFLYIIFGRGSSFLQRTCQRLNGHPSQVVAAAQVS